MDLLLILTYTAICIAVFKIFKIPLTKWTVPTAALGGVILVGALVLLMNYNHPYSNMAREYFVTTPIVPAVAGIVVSVEIEPNQVVEKGTVLFRIDPKPYEAIVRQKQALLAGTREGVRELEQAVAAARASVVQASANRDQSQGVFERYESIFDRGAISENEMENQRQTYLADAAALERAEADFERAQIAFEAGIDGENPEVARLQAELEKARYDVERTIIRAPTSGYVSQLLLRPGMMAANLPLRPVMVFVHDEQASMIAAFRQNSALRLRAGYEAEIVYPSIPGRVFKGEVVSVLPNMAEGQLQTSGNLVGTESFQRIGRVPVVIEVLDDMSEYNLATGSRAQVAVYSDHFHHVAIMRQILLRMSSWQNYLYLDH
ncbi:MAG: HlyD family secretion protein [Gammaproteobacteria bacterium]|nr:HlyD family secretion protein [Gammaproteobacteria bacterium]MDH3751103.1 HlyD family secretion protein [Gammaproteobacteria bacterium]MDH3805059.1 HlyD family secretion protein [Gammaproteobacteria bacterium]